MKPCFNAIDFNMLLVFPGASVSDFEAQIKKDSVVPNCLPPIGFQSLALSYLKYVALRISQYPMQEMLYINLSKLEKGRSIFKKKNEPFDNFV